MPDKRKNMRPQKNPLQYSPYQTIELEAFKQYLELRTTELQTTFRKIITGIKDKSLLKNKSRVVYRVEFYHGVDELDFWLKIFDEQENLIEHEYGDEHFFKIYNKEITYPRVDFNFPYPKEMDVYYEDERWLRMVGQKHLEFFFWFTKNWMAVDGHQIGIPTTALENSIVRVYNFNKMQWGGNINWNPDATYPHNRKLTDYELKKRIGLIDLTSTIPTKWSYFEKENEFVEIGIFSYKYYVRKGHLENFDNIPFEKIQLDNKLFVNQVDEIINEGFIGKPRPSQQPLVHESIKDWKYWTSPQTPIILNSAVMDLEIYLDTQLPFAYKKFISTNLLQSYEKNKPDFPIAIEDWRKIEKYFTPAEIITRLKNNNQENIGKIPIAKTATGELLMMSTTDSSIFIYSNNEFKLIFDSLIDYMDSCIKISTYFCPVKLHIDKGNIVTMKNWFAKGNQLSALKTSGSRSIMQESLNRPEMMELLLNNGADPNKVYIYTDQIDRKTLDLMIEKGLDFQAKLDTDQWLRKNLIKQGGYDDLLAKYPEKN